MNTKQKIIITVISFLIIGGLFYFMFNTNRLTNTSLTNGNNNTLQTKIERAIFGNTNSNKIYNDQLNWRVFSISGNESVLFDVTINDNVACAIPKFPTTQTIGSTTYIQPNTLKLTLSDGTTVALPKTTGKFCVDLSKTKIPNNWFKLGDQSIIIVGDSTYNTNTTNVTQENLVAHLNISNVAPYNSLVLYYPFDGDITNVTTKDFTQLNNDGTYVNITQSNLLSSGCAYGSCVKLVPNMINNNSMITVPATANLNVSALTVSMWIKFDGYGSVNQSNIISKRGKDNTGWNIRSNGFGTRRLLVGIDYDGGTDLSSQSANNILTNGTWNHYVITWDGTATASSAIKYYRDGVLFPNVANTSGVGNRVDDSTTNLIIGNRVDGNALQSWASFDEVMIFNTSLSQAQIQAIYNNQSARFVPSGQMRFQNLNFGTNDTVNITIFNPQTLMESNLSAQINTNNPVNFTSNSSGQYNIFNYNMGTAGTSANLTIWLNAGNESTLFYSPLVIGNITLFDWIAGGAPPSNTCTYTSGNWNIACSDACNITTNVNLGGNNLTINGTGTTTITANITNYNIFKQYGSSSANICVVRTINGGSIKK